MKLSKLVFLVFCLFSSLIKIQAQNQQAAVKTQATAMANALQKKDYNTFSQYVHPKLVAMAGGKTHMLQRIDSANAMARQFGAEIRKISIGEPAKIITFKNELQTTVSQTTEMSSAMGGIIFESTLIAISDDGGKTWRFLDTSLYNVRDIKKAIPTLSPGLEIPPVKPPKFVPKQ